MQKKRQREEREGEREREREVEIREREREREMHREREKKKIQRREDFYFNSTEKLSNVDLVNSAKYSNIQIDRERDTQ